jgi:transposase InsO family protein
MCRILSGRPSLDPIAAEPDATTENFPLLAETDFEAAATHLDGFLVVGTTDQFDQTLVVLGADLRWSLSDLVHRPLNGTTSRPSHADIPDALREKILSWNRYDAILTERARAHLARRVASYAGDFDRDLSLFRELNSLFQRGAPVEELHRLEREARLNGSGQQR